MDKKITQLTELTTSENTDLVIVEDISGTETKKQTKTNLLKEINADLDTKADSTDLDSYVPYTGATTDLDLGANEISTTKVLTPEVKTDTTTPTDFKITTGAEKTVELQESVWNDIQFNIETGRTSSANYPDWDALTTNTYAYKFDVNDYIDLGTNEMLHDWKEGTDIYPHIHIALDGANASGETQYAKFIIYIAYADEDSAYVETNSTIEIAIPDGTADLTHIRGNATALAMTGLTICTQVNIRLKRIAATTGTEYTNHIFATQVGIHYEIDTIGSRTIGIK